MPTPRKPDNVLDITGAKRRNPARYGSRAPQPIDQRDIGRCPSFLTDMEKECWREIIKNDPGVLRRSDRIAVEMAARLIAEIREGDAKAATHAQLNALLHKFGQTPTGRNHVSIPVLKQINKFDAD